jgi:membrane protein implicated in regulation of membrane protease activity
MDEPTSTRKLRRAFRLAVAQICLLAAAGTLAGGNWHLPALDPTAQLLFSSFLVVGVVVAARPVVELLGRYGW